MDFQRGMLLRGVDHQLIMTSMITNISLFKINDFKNRVTNVFYQHGFKHGDKVGLLMENRPEFVATWLGLSKLGIVIPLINHNLKKQSLLHSITIANCNGLIFGDSLKECKFILISSNSKSLSSSELNEKLSGGGV